MFPATGCRWKNVLWQVDFAAEKKKERISIAAEQRDDILLFIEQKL